MKRFYKFLSILLITFVLVASGFIMPVVAQNAETAYETYTYDYNGYPVKSPDAYVVDNCVSGTEIGVDSLAGAQVIISKKEKIYIADTDHNRIVILNKDLTLNDVIDGYVDKNGEQQSFTAPKGVFVEENGDIYISDTDNKRIVELSQDHSFIRAIGIPDSKLLPENYNFAPTSIAVDTNGMIYVVSADTTYGIMVLNEKGDFVSFLGALKTNANLGDLFWKKFMTKEQRSRLVKNVPTNYKSLSIDDKNFVYAVSYFTYDYPVIQAIRTKSSDLQYAMVKKYSPAGNEVLNRLGAYPPSGDLSAMRFGKGSNENDSLTGISQMCAVVSGEEKSYTLFDSRRNKIFTYDETGNLLFAFGGTGNQNGMFRSIAGGCYIDSDLFVLDSFTGKITKYTRTEYGNKIFTALNYSNKREREKEEIAWKEILSLNSTLSLANVKLGNCALRIGDYKQAMDYYKLANDVNLYSKAFEYYRSDILSKYYWVVVLIAAVLITSIILVVKYVNKYNSTVAKNKPGFKSSLLYGGHIVVHPFDGFWDMKFEKRGSLSAALVLLILSIFSMMGKELTTSYIFDSTEAAEYSIIKSFFSIFMVVIIFCAANWSLTSLMDGKGKFTDILMTVAYSMIPIMLFSLPSGLISNCLTLADSNILTFLAGIGYVWSGALLFFGIMTIHQYSLGKNILTFIFTIVGMAIIVFIGVLVINLFNMMWQFVNEIIVEISLRI